MTVSKTVIIKLRHYTAIEMYFIVIISLGLTRLSNDLDKPLSVKHILIE